MKPSRTIALAFFFIAIVLITGCGRRKTKAHVPIAPVIGATEEGIASWYGYPYHGRRAANGDVYDMEKLTAAHKELPFETWVRVLNLSNDKTVDVRITDRGPFVDGRIIDLSRAAAREIEMLGSGVTRVRITVIAPPPAALAGAKLYLVSAGVFRERKNADNLADRLEKKFGAAQVEPFNQGSGLYRVIVGAPASEVEAKRLAAKVRAESGEAAVIPAP